MGLDLGLDLGLVGLVGLGVGLVDMGVDLGGEGPPAPPGTPAALASLGARTPRGKHTLAEGAHRFMQR